jgi:AbrB family looped-hinge helix DNA binding protein
METTRLSSKGQVVLPKSVRDAQGWAPGTEFTIESTSDGVTLRAKAPFPRTDLGEVFGSVKHRGRAKTLQEMDAGIGRAVARRFRRTEER